MSFVASFLQLIFIFCGVHSYPRLYDFFYAELEAASKAIQQNERPPRLHPLLLLIARLYPSGESDSNSKLLSFVPFISTCSSSPELVTRELSAKSIVALIPSNGITQYCLGLLHSMKVYTLPKSSFTHSHSVLYNSLVTIFFN